MTLFCGDQYTELPLYQSICLLSKHLLKDEMRSETSNLLPDSSTQILLFRIQFQDILIHSLDAL